MPQLLQLALLPPCTGLVTSSASRQRLRTAYLADWLNRYADFATPSVACTPGSRMIPGLYSGYAAQFAGSFCNTIPFCSLVRPRPITTRRMTTQQLFQQQRWPCRLNVGGLVLPLTTAHLRVALPRTGERNAGYLPTPSGLPGSLHCARLARLDFALWLLTAARVLLPAGCRSSCLCYHAAWTLFAGFS